METISQNQENPHTAPIAKVPVPNSQGVLILGIFSLVTTIFCAGLIFGGLIMGILAVVMSSRANEMYARNPEAYTESSIRNVNSGRICGIIGIVLNGVLFLFAIIWLFFLGAGLASFFRAFPWEEYV